MPSVRCAATSRTRQPAHSEGACHCSAASPSSSPARLTRSAAIAVTREAEAAVEAERSRHLGGNATAQLRRALTRLREITDPYQ